MNLIDLHRRSRSRASVALHQFLLDFNREAGTIYAFFEGENDESFYMNFIEARVDPTWMIRRYRCNGKDGVYYIRTQVQPRITKRQIAIYFVDRDLDDLRGIIRAQESNLYVTDFYSVENHVVHRTFISRLLRELYHLEVPSAVTDKMVEVFDRQQSKFYRRCLPVMAWMALQMDQGKRVLKNDFRLEVLFPVKSFDTWEKDIAVKISRIAELQRVTPESAPAPRRDLMKMVRKLITTGNPKYYIRGKYDAWFMTNFIKSLIRHLEKMGYRSNCNLNLTVRNLVDQLGPRCKCPDSLSKFLDENLAIASRSAA